MHVMQLSSSLINSEVFKLELGMGRSNLDTKQLFSNFEHQARLLIKHKLES
jgi:hypothetical protein